MLHTIKRILDLAADQKNFRSDREDTILQEQADSAIRELTRGKTLISIAHRLTTVRSADQFVVVSQGKIVQQGSHGDLVKQEGIYRHFWQQRTSADEWLLES